MAGGAWAALGRLPSQCVTWHAEGLTQVFLATLNTVPRLNLGPESPAATRLGEQGPSGWPLTTHPSKGWVRCSPGSHPGGDLPSVQGGRAEVHRPCVRMHRNELHEIHSDSRLGSLVRGAAPVHWVADFSERVDGVMENTIRRVAQKPRVGRAG